MNAMYSAEQINVPPELGTIMKQYTKAILRDKPEHVYKYSANFFAVLSGLPAPFDQDGQLADQAAASRPQKQYQADAGQYQADAEQYQADEEQYQTEQADAEQYEGDPAEEEQSEADQVDEVEPCAAAADDMTPAESPEPETTDNNDVGNDAGDYQENAEMTDEDILMVIFQRYDVGEDGLTSVAQLPDLLADLREALELTEDDLPPAEDILTLLGCESDSIDLLELKQLLFESAASDE